MTILTSRANHVGIGGSLRDAGERCLRSTRCTVGLLEVNGFVQWDLGPRKVDPDEGIATALGVDKSGL